jgi:protein-S-isoprenylcysteine O-methyltransferase Ste14
VENWLVGAVWVAWLVLAGSAGVGRSKPGDLVLDHGTRAWADAATVAALLATVLAWVFLPNWAIAGSWRATVALGIALVAAGVALRLWAAGTLGRFFTQSVIITPGHTVVAAGPYRYVRHPGYAGLLVSMVGLALTLANWASVVITIVGFFIAHVPRIRVEEHALEDHLGHEYRAYERSHKRLIPGVW